MIETNANAQTDRDVADETQTPPSEIAERLERNPDDPCAKLDAGLDQSMDASDPPSVVQPGDTGEPVPSSGYDEAQESGLKSR